MMKKIRIQDAVDMVLGEDVTQIIPEEYKICLLPKRGKNEIKKGGHRMSENRLLDEIFELALQNDMNYLG